MGQRVPLDPLLLVGILVFGMIVEEEAHSAYNKPARGEGVDFWTLRRGLLDTEVEQLMTRVMNILHGKRMIFTGLSVPWFLTRRVQGVLLGSLRASARAKSSVYESISSFLRILEWEATWVQLNR